MKKVSLPRPYPQLDLPHNPNDPDPWQTLWLDQSLPLHPGVKRAWLKDSDTWSRQFLLPLVRPVARAVIFLLQIIKTVFPNWPTSPRLLHRVLARSLSWFATPEANWLILRHFWVGTEILSFLNANIEGAGVEMNPLHPKDLPDLIDNTFLKHDHNLFNFITRLNLKLRAQGISQIRPKSALDFSMISEQGDFPIAPQNAGWFNGVDVQTCIDLFTPVYQAFLSDREFWRSAQSLQLDETIGLYAAQVLNMSDKLFLVNNKHPMVIPATGTTGYRLVLHGLSSEVLHAILVEAKQRKET